jgi:hypothetical protein
MSTRPPRLLRTSASASASLLRGLLLSLGLIAMLPLSLASRPALAQDQTQQRVLLGKVEDKEGAGLKGAVVYLKDGHTLAVRSYISGDDGGYRFGQLAQNTDYTVWAESGGKKSPVKNISSFDSRNQFNFTLKIDPSK